MIACLADQDLARLVLLDEDDTLAPDLLGLDASDQLIEGTCVASLLRHDNTFLVRVAIPGERPHQQS
jgi:hypothetical protein